MDPCLLNWDNVYHVILQYLLLLTILVVSNNLLSVLIRPVCDSLK